MRTRVALSVLAGLAWLGFATWVARVWADDLGRVITPAGAWAVLASIALVPGYVTVQLVVAVLLDRPRPLPPVVRLPDLTVIVAAYNEQLRLAETLEYLLRAEYPGELQIVVADDGSTDGTREVGRGFCARDRRVRLVWARHGGKWHALNAALETVTTPLVATLDADTLLTREALKRAVTRLESMPPDGMAVAGSVMVRNSRANLLTRLQQWDQMIAVASLRRGQSLQQGTLVAQTTFSVHRTAAVREGGGWPDAAAEDVVLTYSMLRRGGRVGYEPTAIAFAQSPTSFAGFLRRHQRRARGTIAGLRAHGLSLIRRRKAYTHAVVVDAIGPVLDTAYTVLLPTGVVLAASGRMWIVAPLLLLVLPLNALLAGVMLFRQHRAMTQVGLVVRRGWRDLLALAVYVLGYQLVLSPVAVTGYLAEGRRRPIW